MNHTTHTHTNTYKTHSLGKDLHLSSLPFCRFSNSKYLNLGCVDCEEFLRNLVWVLCGYVRLNPSGELISFAVGLFLFLSKKLVISLGKGRYLA